MIQERPGQVERFLPLGYFAAALLLVIALLPTVLRPPQQPPTESAEVSPDAPPDEEQQSIISSLNRAVSGTVEDDVPPAEVGGESAIPAPAGRRSATVGRCVGNPPRQTFSLYSPPCAGAFTGDNGGATAFGVTATEFNVVVFVPDTDTAPEGAVDDATTGDSDTKRYLRTFQNFFNRNYQFYGRQMRVFIVKQSINSPQEGTSAAVRARQQYRAFAGADVLTTNYGTMLGAIQQGIVLWTASQDEAFYADNSPLAWSFITSSDRWIRLADEVVCKQMVGKPPQFNEGKTKFPPGQPRKFGILYYADPARPNTGEQVIEGLEACGVKRSDTVAVGYNLTDNTGSAGGAITRMRAAGVTTIIHAGDWFAMQLFSGEAEINQWWPEWVGVGLGGVDQNGLMQGSQSNQWRHAISISFLEIPRPIYTRDDYVAYHSIDATSEYSGQASLSYAQLASISAGVQLAGPRLTPQTFEEGLLRRMPRRPPNPLWSIGGGYGPTDRTFGDYAGIQWWDPTAIDPGNGRPGAYRWVNGGQRYTFGEVPTEPLPFFQSGITQPDDPRVYE